ncbi:ribosomal RNA small subunit methyltransferase A [Agaricicola taiwanensis]|uniref:Ribosomal RNA small subunit methyltransferase A n=1 Tax=Agaricicola taiwanensis TaxID=591372 RepID=A0A8J3DWQ4_9RHOB|nr:16S rRNA (adenine(1518)-N(6)/adenine(1519)-N(6))-dimethyltransferase RsmA [Agaricicola taiwanensis]GGE46871.1 ribosomal RNA small subunit methyltransferase A [Agaricicola taiwanensis]
MSAIDDLPPLREVIRRHELSARKSLGQNFLLDLNLTARIARASGPLEGVTVVEVGPGPGGLTRALLALGAEKVIAIEKDNRAVAALGDVAERYPGQLDIIEGDALAIDLGSRIQGKGRIVANLPYNIGTQLLVGWLTTDRWPPWWDSLTLMFQREVAERIVAAPGSEAYGRLGVLCGWRTEAKIMFDVPPSAFVPPPKVTSSVVRLTPRALPADCSPRDLEVVTQAAFGQRRKMLRQSLKGIFLDLAGALAAADIDPTARAETVSIEGFAALARARATERA